MDENKKKLLLNFMHHMWPDELMSLAVLAYHEYIRREIKPLETNLSKFNHECLSGADYIILYCLDTIKCVAKDEVTKHGYESINNMYKDLSMSVLLDVKKEMDDKGDSLGEDELRKAKRALEVFEQDVVNGIDGVNDRLKEGIEKIKKEEEQ